MVLQETAAVVGVEWEGLGNNLSISQAAGVAAALEGKALCPLGPEHLA